MGPQDETVPQAGSLETEQARYELFVVGPGVLERRSLEVGSWTIGRGAEAAFRIDHPFISRVHLTLFRVGGRFFVEDTASRNGSRLNAQPLERTKRYPLVLGDTLELGPFRLFLQLAAEAPPPQVPVLRSPAMGRMLEQARQVARGTISVLILGETGVGKDVLAQELHAASPRANKPFVRLNCAAVAESLLESELFGHVRGAFTGANEAKRGLVEAADTGTLFLDEVGELSGRLQSKLLHVLETREVTRVGATEPRRVDVRFLAATHRPLSGIAEGFRSDLYYRLAGVVLQVPPLRERPDDVLPLARHFLAVEAQRLERAPPVLTDEACHSLLAHTWPGNIRELRNTMERAVLLSTTGVIDQVVFDRGPLRAPKQPALWSEHEAAERERIIAALDACAGNQTRAAKSLGWARSTLATKLALYRIPRPRKDRSA